MKNKILKSSISIFLVLCMLTAVVCDSLVFSASTSTAKRLDHMGDCVFADFNNDRLFTLVGTKLYLYTMSYGSGYELFDFSSMDPGAATYDLLDTMVVGDCLYALYTDNQKCYLHTLNVSQFQLYTSTLNFACDKMIAMPNGDVLVTLNVGYDYLFIRKSTGEGNFYELSEHIDDFYGSIGSTVYYRTASGLSYGTYSAGGFTQSKKTITGVNPADISRKEPFEFIDGNLAAANTGEVYSVSNTTLFSYDLHFDRSTYSKSLGSMTVVVPSSGLIIGAEDEKHISAYDSDTFDIISTAETVYKPYFLFADGADVLCIEENNGSYYYEAFNISDFVEIETKVIDLNEQPVYANRTADHIAKRYSAAVGNANINQFVLSNEGMTVHPYVGTTIDSGVQNTLVDFSSYLRWLAGLSGYSYGGDTTAESVGKGAVLLNKAWNSMGYTGHTPPKPDDMSEAFYNEAYSTCGGNISYGYGSRLWNEVEAIRALNNDLNNLSNSEIDSGGFHQGYNTPGHRNCFMQRGGNKITYGYCDRVLLQFYEYAQQNPNASGTIIETGNNDTAYSWPAPGAFPADEIDTKAVWTVYFNTDKLEFSKHTPTITITDLDTGETFTRNTEMHDIDGQRSGYSTSNFWGKCLTFSPPTASSYAGKSYRVTVDRLSDENNMPAALTYTVNFFDYNGEYSIDGLDYTMDSYGKLTQINLPTEESTTEEPTTEEPTTEEPTTEEPTTEEPTTEEPTTEEPTTEEPTTEEPTTEEPTTEEPTTEEPTTEEPTTEEPTTEEPTTEEPTTVEPTTEEPTTEEPTTEEPTTVEPTTEEIERFLNVHVLSDSFASEDYSIRITEESNRFRVEFIWDRTIKIDSFKWTFCYDSDKIRCYNYLTEIGAVNSFENGRITSVWSDTDDYIVFNEGDVFAEFRLEALSEGETTITFNLDDIVQHEDVVPTTAEATLDEPTTAEPETEETTSGEPTEEPTTEEPSTAEPTTEEPSTAEPSTGEPTTEEPSTAEPSTAEPTTEELTTAEPTTAPVFDYKIGDVNSDGFVDVIDATIIQKYAVHKITLSDRQLFVSDVNDDTYVDVIDATDIQKFAVLKLEKFKKV